MRKCGIEITGSIFLKNSKQLQENIQYIQENFGKEYLKPLILSKNKKHLQTILPYLEEKGLLRVLTESASILALTLEEIEERISYLQKHNKPIVMKKKKGEAFHSVFGLSRKKYREMIEKEENQIGKE